MDTILKIAPDALRSDVRNARRHSKAQIRKIADSIKAFGFVVPILVDEDRTIIAGHGRLAAAKLLGLDTVPVIEVHGLSPTKRRALAIADNRIPQLATWDRRKLALELPELRDFLTNEALMISVTGFQPTAVDRIEAAYSIETGEGDQDDNRLDKAWLTGDLVSKPGDIWCLNNHRLMCAEPRQRDDLGYLMEGRSATLALLNPPQIAKPPQQDARQVSHQQIIASLTEIFSATAAVSRSGAVHVVASDWRHLGDLLRAADSVYGEPLNIAACVASAIKRRGEPHEFCEFVTLFGVGDQSERTAHDRASPTWQSQVWRHQAMGGYPCRQSRGLPAHAMPKPIGTVREQLEALTSPDDIVLDVYSGFGTTFIAAERLGRRCFGLDREPRFVDLAIRRWQAATREKAVHEQTGLTFDETVQSAYPTPIAA